MRRWRQTLGGLACGLVLHAGPASAQLAGQDVVITLHNGEYFRGVLLKRQQTGFLLQTSVGPVLVPYTDVRDVQTTSAVLGLPTVATDTDVDERHLPASVSAGWALAASAGALALSLVAAHRSSQVCDFSGPVFQPKSVCHPDDSLSWWAAGAGVVAATGVGVALWGHLRTDLRVGPSPGVQVTARF